MVIDNGPVDATAGVPMTHTGWAYVFSTDNNVSEDMAMNLVNPVILIHIIV
jgi:hypothetical protein